MPSLPLPPRGVFVPTALVYATDLSPAAFHTWVQLRGLAWQGGQTPPCTVQDLSKITGKSPSALYGHLAVLKACGALRWRSTGRGSLTIVFDTPKEQADLSDRVADDTRTTARADPRRPSSGDQDGEMGLSGLDSRFQESGVRDSRTPESGISPSLNPINQDMDLKDGLREEGKSRLTGIPDPGVPISRTLGSRKSKSPVRETPITRDAITSDIIAIYRELTGRRPNQSQRAELLQRVIDPGLWRRTLAHWQVHGWNPGNFAGLLDLYQRGGPEACRYCTRKEPPSQHDPIDELIAELQKEAEHVRPTRDRRHPENPD